MSAINKIRHSPMSGIDKSNTDMAVPSSEATTSRAPSTPPSATSRFLSQNPLNHLTRRWSVSPLSSRSNRAGLRSSTSITKLGDSVRKMSTPSTPTPSTPDTVRKRRGFRPLSIVTSALFPFDFDPVQTMEETQSGQAAVSTPSKPPQDIANNAQPGQLLSSPTFSDRSSSTTPSPSKAASVNTQVDMSDTGALGVADRVRLSSTSTFAEKKSTPAPSIKTQLEKISVEQYLQRMKLSTPPQDTQEAATPAPDANVDQVTIADEYPQFYNLPPPDPTQHPSFRLDPFNCTDTQPPLTTNWTKYQIKQYCADKYLRDRNMIPEDDGKSSIRSKINPFNQKSPEKEQTSIFEALTEGSPEPPSAKHKTVRTPRREISRNTTPVHATFTSTPITDDFDKRSGLRSLSNLFKPRTSSETGKPSNASSLTISSPIDQSIIHPTATPELKRYDLERYLRIICNCPSIEFTWASMYPRHPNTSKEWKSRNLKCTNCLNVCCSICGRACCAYKAATLGVENHRNNPPGREEAYQRIVDISTVFPYGKEAPTFLECTTCRKVVCPDCCGMCPIDGCSDLECRRCKRPDPWKECDWHYESTRCASISTAKWDSPGNFI